MAAPIPAVQAIVDPIADSIVTPFGNISAPV
jgi:hypothetical protein